LKVYQEQTVVVLGAMNPAIHHPAWYHIMAIITEPEYKKSLSGQIIANPTAAQFVSEGFSILCLPDRWQVLSEATDATRIVEIAKVTFKTLDHTPVSAYGINHHFHVETTKQIPSTLMTIVRQTGLPFPPDEVGTAAITYIAESKGCTFTTVISASSKGPNFLHVQNNAHFSLPSEETIKKFDLGPLLEKAFEENEARAQLMLSNLVSVIQGLK
jgi:hypothetical protein